MEDLLKVLDKLLELGKVYGLPGLVVAAFTIISVSTVKVIGEKVVEDRKDARAHKREMTEFLAKLERRRKKPKD